MAESKRNRGRQVFIAIPLHDRLRAMSERTGITMTRIISRAVEAELARMVEREEVAP